MFFDEVVIKKVFKMLYGIKYYPSLHIDNKNAYVTRQLSAIFNEV